MPKRDPDHADEAPQQASIVQPAPAPKTRATRADGATFVGGVWLAADGSPLTDKEAQQAHRAADRAAAEARARILRGEA